MYRRIALLALALVIAACDLRPSVNLPTINQTNAILTIDCSSSSEPVPIGTMGAAGLTCLLAANDAEDISLTELTVDVSGDNLAATDIERLYLLNKIGTTVQTRPTGSTVPHTINFANSAGLITVQRSSTTWFNIHYTVGAPGQAVLGHRFNLGLLTAPGNIRAYGVSSGNPVAIKLIGTRGGIKTIVPFEVKLTELTPNPGDTQTIMATANTSLARYQILNTGTSQIEFVPASLEDRNVQVNTVEYSWFYSDTNSKDYTANRLADESALSLRDNAPPIAIDAGTARYFSVTIARINNPETISNWALSIRRNSLVYSIEETKLKYDGNGDGKIGGRIDGLPITATTTAFGQIVKS